MSDQPMRTFRPLGDTVVVVPEKHVDHVGLIIVPDSAKKRCDVARVVAIGPGFWTFKGRRWPMPDIKPGDRVILVPELAQWAPFYMHGDEKRLILKADGILSAVDEGVDILSVRKVAS